VGDLFTLAQGLPDPLLSQDRLEFDTCNVALFNNHDADTWT
jgi:hypothetical protein